MITYNYYKITNKINGKIYIGITKGTIIERLKSHFRESKRSNYYFMRALKKYPNRNNWVIELIESRKYDNRISAQKREDELIIEHNSLNEKVGYNTSLSNYNPNNSTRKNIYQYGLNGVFINEYKSMVDAAKIICPDSINGSFAIGQCIKGKTKSCYGFQWKDKKMSKIEPYELNKAKSYNGKSAKKVKMIINESDYKIFESTFSAAKYIKEHKKSKAQIKSLAECIRICCLGKSKTCQGFMWEYC